MNTILERTYDAPPERIWELWTTPAGIESWWAPEGFEVKVLALDLRPEGELRYAMTAVAPEMVAFMEQNGMPATNESLKTFTAVEPCTRLAYTSLIDFVPGVPPYSHLTVVELEPSGDGTHVTMTMDSLHDVEWTQRLVAGRENELANLALLF